ncbi:hypothetical protein AKJ09_04132 [Labilithrix luteola]|uniref:DUF3147 family protein n=1 Tax=Labilithrix luteola TaxID=1391654 RepID=A0A0K1PVA9_9BACT|nr:DUF3147 family protein [Labilithrix luteola]AKU97468.1 hypothetical protein AKJ09_04132 [Labilithrix luteola]
MRPSIDFEPLKQLSWKEHLVRFFFGGVITVVTGLVAHFWGPSVGGLLLAFPAILPATLTLLKEHDGRRMAAEDACGARLGAIGMAAFALVVWQTSHALAPPVVLILALVAWTTVSVTAWELRYRHSTC